MEYVSGHILTETGFQKGFLCIKDENVVDQGSGLPPKTPIEKGFIVPTFIDMHTHVGDGFIRKKDILLPHDIMQLVAPPHGLKHRLLAEAKEEDILSGMNQTIQEMIVNGTSLFVDFRENGIKGISVLRDALSSFSLSSLVLARPERLQFDKNEINDLLKNADGIGLSSISDWPINDIEDIASLTHKNDKIFAIHASERIREDIDTILGLKPSFLVHMNNATKSDLEMTKAADIPIVLCPRSNSFFNIMIQLPLLKKIGNDVLLGTDNAMLHEPSLTREIIYLLHTFPDVFSLEELLYMVTYGSRKALNLKDSIPQLTFPASFLVLHKETLEPIYRFQRDM